jgi:glycerophosphoryl diester phosphodiesterase
METTRTRTVLNVAHRGASAHAPENTLAAVRRAVSFGSDLVELDVQRSRDGALVLLHDQTLTRTTDVRRRFPRRAPWRVGDFSYDELARLDAGSWRSPRFAGERIPTLEAALDVLELAGTGLLLELKAPGSYPGIAGDVVSLLRSRPSAAVEPGRVLVQSFDFAAAREVKTREPRLRVGLLGMPAAGYLPALATWADQVNPHHARVTSSYVDAVHELGMGCLVWTVDRVASMRRAVAVGVDGVITNRSDRMARVASERSPRGQAVAALQDGAGQRMLPVCPRE